MATNDPKKHRITGNLVANMLTEREDDYTFNVTYTANRTIKDLCKLAAKGKSKFTASELENAYNDLEEQAKIELFNAATVEFGLANNSLGVDGSFIGPGAKFDPNRNSVTLRCSPRAILKEELESISVIVGQVSEGLPTITKVTDVSPRAAVSMAKESAYVLSVKKANPSVSSLSRQATRPKRPFL